MFSKEDLLAISSILSNYKSNAKIKEVKFELSKEEFVELIMKDCYYCGKSKSNCKKNKNKTIFRYNGIDRFNPLDGYNINNCVPCCFICNYSKSDMTIEEFIKWLSRLRSNLVAKTM